VPTSSTLLETDHMVLAESRLLDIAPVFNLIQAGSLNGNFSNLYTQPRYMAGLGMQLFSIWKNGRIKLPDGTWHRANMQVLRVSGDFAGFVILREEAGHPNDVEIYMCGVEDRFRGQGLGERMLRAALSEVPSDYSLFADCLPDSIQMKSLLRKLGFDEIARPTSTPIPRMAQRFVRGHAPMIS